MLVCDIKQANIICPAIRLLCYFVNAFADELLTIAQYLNLVNHIVRRLERCSNLLERLPAPERDQSLRWQAGAFQNRAAVRDHVEQRLLHLIGNVLISNINIKAGRVARANTSRERAGILVRPRANRIFVM